MTEEMIKFVMVSLMERIGGCQTSIAVNGIECQAYSESLKTKDRSYVKTIEDL